MIRAAVALERIRSLIRRHAPERDVRDEIAFHVEMETARLLGRGSSPEEARRSALARFGDVGRVRTEMESIAHQLEDDMRRTEYVEEIKHDIRFGLRLLRRSPVFTVVALVTIAIGVGATTAMFSVVEAVLLRGVPYPTAARLVVIGNGTGLSKGERTAVAAAEFADIGEQMTSMEQIAAIRDRQSVVAGACGAKIECAAEQVSHYDVSPNLFDVLGIRPSVGRSFVKTDGSSAAARVVVLSHPFWQRRFGGDSAIVGRTITLGGLPHTVVGILSADVRFPDAPIAFLSRRPDVWTAHSWEDARSDNRGNQYLAVIGRMRSGGSIERVRADLSTIAGRFRAEYPNRYARNTKWHLIVLPFLDDMIGDARPVLLTLFGAVGVLLLIACGNIVNLLLARGAARERELALRIAIGAQRQRIVRQLITESLLLALGGGAVGIVLAFVAVPLLTRLDPGNVPRFETATVNLTVLAFALGVSMVVGVGVGVIPALRFSRGESQMALKPNASGVRDARSFLRLRGALVIAEVSLALVVLVMSGLLVRTIFAIDGVPLGLQPAQVLTFEASLPSMTYDSAYKRAAFEDRLQRAMQAIPGVTVASGVNPLPMAHDGWSGSYTVDAEPNLPSVEPPHAEYSVALPGYFRAMSIPLIAGRDFTDRDVRGGDAVVIIDEALAKRHWPGQSPLGQRMNRNSAGISQTVIGVVGHARREGPIEESEPQLYLAALQSPQTMLYYVVKGRNVAALGPAMREAVASIDRGVPVTNLRPMDDVVSGIIARQRFNSLLFVLFGLAAVSLAAIGLYGVMGYLVSQRRQEIGIRLALGGSRQSVVRMVVGQGMTMTTVGVVVGLAVASFATRLVAPLLFGVSTLDWPTFAGITLLILAVAVVATVGPAVRAARTDPTEAIRS